MSANNNLGTAGVALYADTADFSAGMDKAGATAEREMRRVARESAMAERIVSELGRRMQLGAQIAENLLGNARIGADELEDGFVQLARLVELDDRNLQTLFEQVFRFEGGHAAAHVE